MIYRESDADFNVRIDAEDREALAVKCPLESGKKRIRHCRRLLEARKKNGK
jgi:hypothetical protein